MQYIEHGEEILTAIRDALFIDSNESKYKKLFQQIEKLSRSAKSEYEKVKKHSKYTNQIIQKAESQTGEKMTGGSSTKDLVSNARKAINIMLETKSIASKDLKNVDREIKRDTEKALANSRKKLEKIHGDVLKAHKEMKQYKGKEKLDPNDPLVKLFDL